MVLKKLAVPFLALALVVGSCGGDDPPAPSGSGGAGGRSGGSGGGGRAGSGGSATASGGSTGSGGSMTASGGSTGSGGSSTDGGGDTSADGNRDGGDTSGDTGTDRPAETGTEAGGDTTSADICAAYVAGSGSLAGIAAADFCAKYATVCTFTGAERYTSMGDCVTKYNAVATAAKTCRAGHLCNAAMPGGVAMHCPHATGLNNNTCAGP
jgi:hypothetical protein